MEDQTMSNLERSRIARADQGTYETEVSIGGREDLATITEECSKNPGHTTFKSVENLSLQDFPQEYQDPDVLECALRQASLTVCLVVNYTSPSRPEKFPGSDNNYPFYNMRGSNGSRFGTGSILAIHDIDQYSSNCKCYCKECIASGNPKTEWGKIIVLTAKHVVFNDEEGQHTEIELFYDSVTRDQVCKLSGTVKYEQMDYDWCMIYCPTHDMTLVRKLQDNLHRYDDLKRNLHTKYMPLTPKLAVVTSHPHGCHKQITVGTWTEREELGPKHTRYTYTADTCPGCSGAKVWILAEYEECMHTCHMHSQAITVHRNMSGVGWY
ncbi:unnamed protein product [Candidula unifasciata]|uniref:Uncharacterized protein n=1 Tax=Candidula unifasciata TaxID=100452 RepID=A0A8S3YHN6_9EUPU|nr:unnamed protein product [Candidula unifasciata]